MNRRHFAVMRKTLCAAAAIAAVSACKTIVPYVPPSGPDTARLLIRTSVPSGMVYGIYAHEDASSCRGPQRIALGGAGNASHASQLRGGPLTTLKYVGGDRLRTCTIVFSFLPKPKHTYLLATNQDNAGCYVRLLDATDADHPRTEKSYVRRVVAGAECRAMGVAPKSNEDGSEIYQGGPGIDPGTRPASGGDQLSDFKDLLPAK
jgi:hypothetical protein